MTFLSSEKLSFILHLSIGLLSVLQLTECDKIRLVGPSRCAGRVEVYHRDSWGTVCDDHWSILNAEVVCRELNCGAVIDAKKGAFFGEGKESIWLDDVQCVGNESTILKCPHKPLGTNNCDHNEDAGVVCSDHARLVNGSNRCSGRVEIFHNGQWKRACSGDWSKDEATVLCRDISCGSPSTVVPNFGESQNLKAVKTNCVGNETLISECTQQELDQTCIDAVTVCTNSKPIRLANGTHRCSGRVEIYHEKSWGTICDDRWGMQDAIVTCREMNCGQALGVKYRAHFGQGQDRVWLDDVECTGHETTLGDCSHRGFGEHDCDHNEDAGVICSETLRLVNGNDSCSGRVEVFQNNAWGKLCYDNWGKNEASVLCKELNCGAPKKSQETFNYGDTTLPGYTARCTGDAGSFSQCNIQPRAGTCQAVSVACAGLPPLRLANGTNQCSGRVEVLHDGAWGTVCDDDWDIRDAQVVCRAMDCGTAQTAKSSAYFGMGEGNIWMDDVQCIGNETSLLNCQRPAFGESNCGHGEDAGVICSDTIRLINGTDQCSGRVEFKNGGHWHPAFNMNWGTNEATVVCREMNCGDPVAFSGSFGQTGARTGYQITCVGRENSLSQCALREHTRDSYMSEVSIKCSGNVKFVGGSSRCVGRVEFYDKGRWGTVCADSWDINDAMVVCRQMDCGKAHKISAVDAFGQGTGHTWLNQVECTGTESTLAQCRQSPYIGGRVCNATSVAGVICAGSLEVRLVDGKDDCTGRVEVRHGETWSTVCDTDWTVSKGEVVCDMLECGRAMSAPGGSHFGPGTGPVVEATDSCFGNMTFLKQCSLNGFRPSKCSHEHDAGVLCAAQIRLANGPSTCSGRVEVFYKSEWGSVCDDEWGMPDADVVCRQLGCGHAVSAPHSAHFGRGSGPIWLDNVDCSGEESALSHCTHPKFGENNCGHSEDASVICLGALQKPQITISPSSQVNWGDKVEITCTVISEQVGGTFTLKTTQGSFHKEKFSEHEAVTFFFPAVDFDQRGSYFCEYQKKLSNQVINYPQGNPIDLSITVKLDKPNIFLTSPHAMLIYSPDKVSVNRGNTLSVTCSTYSRYPGGFFHLMKADTNTSEIKPAFGHFTYYTASFDFPLIDYVHQGEYTCIYGVNISTLSFCSAPSKSLQVTVAASSSSSATTAIVLVLFLLLVLLGIGYLYWKKRWRGTGVMVEFSNRFGGALKRDTDDRSNGMLDSRDRNNPMYDSAVSRSFEDKNAEEPAESEQAAEGGPEDLAGKVCYELEPLVVS